MAEINDWTHFGELKLISSGQAAIAIDGLPEGAIMPL